MYAPFEGLDFIKSYRLDRESRLSNLMMEKSPNKYNIDNALIDYAKTFSYPVGFLFQDLDKTIRSEEALHALLFSSAQGRFTEMMREWLLRLVQRFEVTKKIYYEYGPGFRKGRGDYKRLERYVELAILLAVAYRQSMNLQYLSTQIKLCDLILSVDKSMIISCCSKDTIRLLVDAEYESVDKLISKTIGVSWKENLDL